MTDRIIWESAVDSLDRRTSDNTDALALWQGAVDRLAAKVDALERAHLARATSHDLTGDAVTRLVSKVDELDGFCSGLRSRCGAIEQEARQHMRHATELADVQTAALAALGDRVAELNDASDKMHARLVSLADRVRGLDPSLPDAPKSAATDGPLDLATLRVPCAKEPLDWARIADGQLQLGPDEDGDPCEPRITLTPPSARLLARALTQWANDQEGKGS